MRTVTGQEKDGTGKEIWKDDYKNMVSDQRFVGVPFIEPTEGLLANIR